MNPSGDLTGQVFGKLSVLWKHKQSLNGGASWVCRCTCGHIDIVSGYKLLNGSKTHCSYCRYGRFEFFDGFNKDLCILPDGNSFQFDFADFPIVSRYSWSRMKNGYYKTSLGSRKAGHILLHRLLMNPPDDLVVDHIDGDKNNYCRSNLRICSTAENSRNTTIQKDNCSGYKGVSYDSRRNKWVARIYKEKQFFLGQFDTPQEAAEVYDEAALLLHGDFAKTNEMIKEKENDEEILELAP